MAYFNRKTGAQLRAWKEKNRNKFPLTFLAAVILSTFFANAEDVVIKDPGYFTEPIRDRQPLFPDSLVFPGDAEEIHIPDLGNIGQLSAYAFPKLKKVTFGNIDYLPGGLFYGMPELEEVVFDGLIGHFDCSMALYCPKLKKITFRGPIGSTGGGGVIYNSPSIENIIFESVIIDANLPDINEEYLCPAFKGYVFDGAIINPEQSNVPKATPGQIAGDERLRADLEKLAQWQIEVLTASGRKNRQWMRAQAYNEAKSIMPFLKEISSPKASELEAAMEYAWNLGDDVRTKLDILKESPAYTAGDHPDIQFRYASPSDSLLTLSRVRFNLDSVAGNGTDIERIKNILYWVHDNIRHDGGNGLAPGARNLRNTYDSSRRDSCGYNCRALAISLTEALLSLGIPARYITCMSKDWKNDTDSHVISVAWSESLGKWIWVDPTFAAFVTDENGLLLHPGEVRYRLQHDLPLILNEDANWNHLFTEEKEEYLDEYMAKNLYLMEANSLNQAEPEGQTGHRTGSFITLVPQGFEYDNSHYITSDDQWFWQPPRLQTEDFNSSPQSSKHSAE